VETLVVAAVLGVWFVVFALPRPNFGERRKGEVQGDSSTTLSPEPGKPTLEGT
jgi:hypothetical protein